MQNRKSNLSGFVELSLLVSVTVVLQLTAGFIPTIGTARFSFTLIPIAVAAVFHGVSGGLIVGSAFGLVVLIQSITGVDPSGFILWNLNWFYTLITILVRAALVGALTALVYRAASKTFSNRYAALVVTGIAAPVINTSLFLLAFTTLFNPVLHEWAGDAGAVDFIVFTLVGLNFLLELLTTAVLLPPIAMVLKEARN